MNRQNARSEPQEKEQKQGVRASGDEKSAAHRRRSEAKRSNGSLDDVAGQQSEGCETHRREKWKLNAAEYSQGWHGEKKHERCGAHREDTAWGENTARIKCWADASDDSSGTEPQTEWQQANAATKRGAQERSFAVKIDKQGTRYEVQTEAPKQRQRASSGERREAQGIQSAAERRKGSKHSGAGQHSERCEEHQRQRLRRQPAECSQGWQDKTRQRKHQRCEAHREQVARGGNTARRTEPQTLWEQMNVAEMKGCKDRGFAAKKRVLQLMRRWLQEVLLGLAESLECDA